jgi:hypothetical protein
MLGRCSNLDSHAALNRSRLERSRIPHGAHPPRKGQEGGDGADCWRADKVYRRRIDNLG